MTQQITTGAKRLRHILYSDTTATEVWLSQVLLFCGLWVLLPFQTINVPFRMLDKILPEGVFALWLMAVGCFRFHAVFYDRRRARATAALLSFGTWMFLLYLSLIIDARSLANVIYSGFAAMSCWVFFRIPRHDVDG